LAGSHWSARALLNYLSNVIADYEATLSTELLGRIEDVRHRANWLVTFILCEWLSKRAADDEFALPHKFPLPGIARFRKWSAKELLEHIAMCVIDSEERLRELFLAPGRDPLTRLEWAEVMWINNEWWRRGTGDNLEMEPSLECVLDEASLDALTHRGEYSYNEEGSALIREIKPPASEPGHKAA
jgi:hypothetical protein